MSVVLRNTIVDWDKVRGPIFMCLGPGPGAQDWELDCYRLLEAHYGNDFLLHITRKYADDHPLMAYRTPTVETIDGRSLEQETDAKRYYIAQAGWSNRLPRGCIICWLPLEDPKHPCLEEEGPYAHEARDLIGEIRGRMIELSKERRGHVRFVIGADENFPGLASIRRNFERAERIPRITIYSTLEKTVEAAVAMTTPIRVAASA
ncbi:MAG TPA: hypothetical protein VEA36_01830 [Candidatus Paceibacterota bacterium]|nr:hypothetical protein [Candidatus Paceibacterota bacterium]